MSKVRESIQTLQKEITAITKYWHRWTNLKAVKFFINLAYAPTLDPSGGSVWNVEGNI